jgi:carboxymethylenebutenolidase
MTFTTPRTLRLAAAAMLFSLAGAPVYAQDWAKTRLEASPGHHEYVPLKHGDRTVQAFVVFPEVKTKAPVAVPANKTARDEAFARLVKLLEGM